VKHLDPVAPFSERLSLDLTDTGTHRQDTLVGWARAPASWVLLIRQSLTGLPSHQQQDNIPTKFVQNYTSIFLA